jgi:hypothetical protein
MGSQWGWIYLRIVVGVPGRGPFPEGVAIQAGWKGNRPHPLAWGRKLHPCGSKSSEWMYTDPN